VDQGHFVSFRPADGSSALSSTHGRWGGYFGYFADPDGNLWKIVAGAGDQPYAE
jgi:uncharacterized glyoxalase superfamily protein PhnB